jgi:hypothetical protein
MVIAIGATGGCYVMTLNRGLIEQARARAEFPDKENPDLWPSDRKLLLELAEALERKPWNDARALEEAETVLRTIAEGKTFEEHRGLTSTRKLGRRSMMERAQLVLDEFFVRPFFEANDES